MRAIFENVISRGNYDLAGLLAKIDTYHIMGNLSTEDRDELCAMARATAKANYDYALEIEKIWAAIRELRMLIETKDEEDTNEPVEEWAEYIQPTGAHDSYQIGAQVTFNEKHYRCLIANCVWSPDVLPSAWELVVEDAE